MLTGNYLPKDSKLRKQVCKMYKKLIFEDFRTIRYDGARGLHVGAYVTAAQCHSTV